jgi:3-oxoacyl-[acyl-carrier protein] reductase
MEVVEFRPEREQYAFTFGGVAPVRALALRRAARRGGGCFATTEEAKVDLGLQGLRALVTGGTRGIGRAIVDALAAEGAAVGFCARTARDVTDTAGTLTRSGSVAVGRAVDVADEAGMRRWVEDSAAELGGLDIVVANVSALAIPDEAASWRASFDVDMMGTVRLVNAAMPYLERSDAASIVTIASVSGREIDFAAGPYGVFKAAIIHYTQGLAYQLAPKGIRANSLSPGNTYFPGGVWQDIEQHNPQLFAQAMALNPTGRMAKPEEIARAAVFLASPAASFVTGANLLADGALTRGVQF